MRRAAEEQRRAGTEDGGRAEDHHPCVRRAARRASAPRAPWSGGRRKRPGAGGRPPAAARGCRGGRRRRRRSWRGRSWRRPPPSAASKALREPSTFTLSASRGSSTRNARCTRASAPSRSVASAGSRVSRTTSRTPSGRRAVRRAGVDGHDLLHPGVPRQQRHHRSPDAPAGTGHGHPHGAVPRLAIVRMMAIAPAPGAVPLLGHLPAYVRDPLTFFSSCGNGTGPVVECRLAGVGLRAARARGHPPRAGEQPSRLRQGPPAHRPPCPLPEPLDAAHERRGGASTQADRHPADLQALPGRARRGACT